MLPLLEWVFTARIPSAWRKDIEIEHRLIAEHLAPMGNVRGNDE